MQTWYEADGIVAFEWDDMEFRMTREEAEVLFVSLGHTLQDMDTIMDNYAEDKGDQPNG